MLFWCHNNTIWCHNSSTMATINRKYTWLPVLLLPPRGYSIWRTENSHLPVMISEQPLGVECDQILKPHYCYTYVWTQGMEWQNVIWWTVLYQHAAGAKQGSLHHQWKPCVHETSVNSIQYIWYACIYVHIRKCWYVPYEHLVSAFGAALLHIRMLYHQ